MCIIQFILDLGVLLFYCFLYFWKNWDGSQPWSGIVVLSNGVCVLWTLAFFELVDRISKWEKDIKVLRLIQEANQKDLDNKEAECFTREKMVAFLNCWCRDRLECGINRLELHLGMAGDPPDPALVERRMERIGRDLKQKNEVLEVLDVALGDVQWWREVPQIPHGWQERVGNKLKQIERLETDDLVQSETSRAERLRLAVEVGTEFSVLLHASG